MSDLVGSALWNLLSQIKSRKRHETGTPIPTNTRQRKSEAVLKTNAPLRLVPESEVIPWALCACFAGFCAVLALFTGCDQRCHPHHGHL